MPQKQDKFKKQVDEIIAKDSRYPFEAYEYVSQAVGKVCRELAEDNNGETRRHISGKQLIDGLKVLLLKDFDRMAIDVLKLWNVNATDDIGNIVFNLVNAKLLGVSENDSIDDFKNQGDFYQMFVAPFEVHLDDSTSMPVINKINH